MNAPLLFPQTTPGSGYTRVPPHNYEAEQALLGAILLSNRTCEIVADFLKPAHFADPVHGRIFAACKSLINQGSLANPVTLKTHFEHDGGLSEIGGTTYLAQLANSVVSVINAEDYGRLIYDLHLRRELIGVGEDLVNKAFAVDYETDALDIASEAEIAIAKTVGDVVPDDTVRPFADVLLDSLSRIEAVQRADGQLIGVTTGLRDLDKCLGGLQPTDLIILAGRPSMGKSALAQWITRAAAEACMAFRQSGADHQGIWKPGPVLFCSLEMNDEQLASRELARETAIDLDRLRKEQLSQPELEKVMEAICELRKLPLFIDHTPLSSVSALRTRARRLKRRQKGLGLIVVDYLQLIGSGDSDGDENRTQQVSAITRSLKQLAKELEVPILALSQLSRAVESREDKRPMLSDLRESGSIEQDADVVMFAYREQYYLERSEPVQRAEESREHFNTRFDQWQARCEESWNICDIIVAKQRHGSIGTVKVGCKLATMTFLDQDQRPGHNH